MWTKAHHHDGQNHFPHTYFNHVKLEGSEFKGFSVMLKSQSIPSGGRIRPKTVSPPVTQGKLITPANAIVLKSMSEDSVKYCSIQSRNTSAMPLLMVPNTRNLKVHATPLPAAIQLTSHCLNRWWPRVLTPYAVTRLQWVNKRNHMSETHIPMG